MVLAISEPGAAAFGEPQPGGSVNGSQSEGRHLPAPPPEVFDDLRFETPNIPGRMDNLRAAILRPELATLEDRVARWKVLYRRLESQLAGTPGLRLILRPAEAR